MYNINGLTKNQKVIWLRYLPITNSQFNLKLNRTMVGAIVLG